MAVGILIEVLSMEKREFHFKKFWLMLLSYVLVGAVVSAMTLVFIAPGVYGKRATKLQEIFDIVDEMYIGNADPQLMEDAAASAMIYAIGDEWSYYVPASSMTEYENQHTNSYVGIGVTIKTLEDGSGFEIQKLSPNGPAKEGGLMPGDVIVAVEGQRVSELGTAEAQAKIAGESGTKVKITVLRDGQETEFELTRQEILNQVASGYMVTDTVGYIKINNFNDRCAQEVIAKYEELEKQGATAFVFDVRGNPGGYVHEMVEVLDYLLPEGVLFRSEDYSGYTTEDTSDAECKDAPVAILINGDSYSAAEFFAAALVEYERGTTVGQPTTGKGRFQQTINLSDGSALNLSVGKYTTPKGVDLSEVGGLKPMIVVDVDQDTMNKIYSETLKPEEDVQLQAAIKALQEQ